MSPAPGTSPNRWYVFERGVWYCGDCGRVQAEDADRFFESFQNSDDRDRFEAFTLCLSCYTMRLEHLRMMCLTIKEKLR